MTAAADIVVVNWNSGGLLANCIASLARFPAGVGQVIVVDNASADSSGDVVAENLQLVILRQAQNEGFARACNIGAARATAPYVLFLNPDTEFLDNDSLPRVLAELESEAGSDIGIAGIRLIDEIGRTQKTCSNFTDLTTFIGLPFGLQRLFPKLFKPLFADFDYSQSRDVEQPIGAFLLIRRRLFEELGGFDERFFVYWEEADLCLRAARKGARIRYFATSKAYHKGQGTSEKVKALRLFFGLRGRIFYAFKHFSAVQAWLVLILAMGVEPVTRIAFALLRGEAADTVKGYRMFLSQVPAILAANRQLTRPTT